MLFFKSKEDCPEFLALVEYKSNIDHLLSLDKYISKKECFPFINENKEVYDKLITLENESVLVQWCKKNKINRYVVNFRG